MDHWMLSPKGEVLRFGPLKVTSCLRLSHNPFTLSLEILWCRRGIPASRTSLVSMQAAAPQGSGDLGDPMSVLCPVHGSALGPGQGELRTRLFVGTGDLCQAIELTQRPGGRREFHPSVAAAVAAPLPGVSVPAFPRRRGQAAPRHLFVLVLLPTKYLPSSPRAGAELRLCHRASRRGLALGDSERPAACGRRRGRCLSGQPLAVFAE